MKESQHVPGRFKKNKYKDAFIPLGIGAVIILLSIFSVFSNLNTLFFDSFLKIRPEIKQDSRILLLDVNDLAIDKLGAWPWPRNYMADALITMSEFGVRSVVFDIEYNTPSPAGINRKYLDENVKRNFKEAFTDLSSEFSNLFSAIKEKRISIEDADYYINELISLTDISKDELYEDVQHIAIDNDEYLSKAIDFFGNVTTAYRFLEEENKNLTEDDRTYITSLITLNVKAEKSPAQRYVDILPTLASMIERGKLSGFVNVEVDSDGKRRRIMPIEFMKGNYYGQLIFSTVLDWLGNPEVVLEKRKLTLKGAQYEDGVFDVVIPLEADGTMLVNWPHRTYDDSFKHLSIYYLVNYNKFFTDLASNISLLEMRDSLKLLPENPVSYLNEEKAYVDYLLENALTEQTEEAIEEYKLAKEQWLISIEDFLSQNYNSLLQKEILKREEAADWNQRTLLAEERKNTEILFGNLKKNIEDIRTNQKLLRSQLEGTLCLIGYTGTGTSDIGANPFQKEYINVGTHASAANTIFQREFLRSTPEWVSLALSVILPFLLFLIARKLNPVRQSFLGIGAILLTIVVSGALFIYTGIFFELAGPVIALSLTYISYSLIRFFRESREKSFLRKAFGTYISADVINQIVDDPDKLKLGGESRHMTAMFTDVKGFSTISEKLTPEQLVSLLNAYLTGMSDIILDEEGVVDKYEGDAIIAFWGAPTPLENHAYHALASAIKMKKVEAELNKTFREKQMSPTDLLSRFGINTGEMVAGNMGTQRKMNYTIMGNAVNLAARLEGVNKMYGTWILTTDYTAKEAGEAFIYRKLDRVRVVGINTPVQLLEVVCFKEDLQEDKKKFLADYETAYTLFEQRQWKKAEALFTSLKSRDDTDGPVNLYLKRCKDFIQNPPAVDWDGVFNMTQK